MLVQGSGPGKSSCCFIGNISQLTKNEIESVLTDALTAKSFRLDHLERMRDGAPFEMTGMEFGGIRFYGVKNWPGCIDMNRMTIAPQSLTQEPNKWQHH